MAVTDSTRLGCGRTVDDLWENIGGEPDRHEAHCPDCRTARQNLRGLASAATALTDLDDGDERIVSRPGALEAIMAIIRTEVRRGRSLPLLSSPPDQPDRSDELTVSEQSVAGVVRAACDALPDVEARRCRVRVADDQAGPGGVDTGRTALVVELHVTVAPAAVVPALADELRAAVGEAVARRVGVPLASMDLHVEDLHDV